MVCTWQWKGHWSNVPQYKRQSTLLSKTAGVNGFNSCNIHTYTVPTTRHCSIYTLFHLYLLVYFLAPLDKSVNLDQLLIQLKEVEPHWMGLGQAVGIDEKALESIQSQVCERHTVCVFWSLT